MRQLTALFDAPLPASAARRALAAAGFADADIDGFSTPVSYTHLTLPTSDLV